MDAERWRRAREVFSRALEVPAGERTALVEQLCAGDGRLLAEVRSLLVADRAAGSYLEEPALVSSLEAEMWIREAGEGDRCGPYRLLGRLGSGGMGVVYLAERDDDEFQRQVALKLLRPGVVSSDLVQRFRTERQILATLDHPHIARLFDGGTTPEGVPYFAMEYVEGEPIDRYCARLALPVDERLRLLQDVCHAVQCAHQSLVIHRDLKPSNVLVTKDGAPKLLDFGIAKLLARHPARAAMVSTLTGQRLMTPLFASPEQVRGEPVTTATDVYALGVLAFQVLTGQAPYRTESDSPLELAEAICEQEPARPSDVVLADAPPRRAGPEARRLNRQLRGDLDNLVAKAMRKEPHRRYASAQQLADDIGHHLDGLPISARPSTWSYRLGKLLRRNKLASAAVVTLFLGALAFGIAMEHGRRVVALERDRATRVTEFMIDLFRGADPEEMEGEPITVRQLLDRAAERLLAGQHAADPRIVTDLHEALGVVYLRLGLSASAATHLEAALEGARQERGERHPETVRLLGLVGAQRIFEGDYEQAEEHLGRAVRLAQEVMAEDDPHRLKIVNDLGVLRVATGDYGAAEALFTTTLEARRQLDPRRPYDVAESHNNLGTALYYQGRYVEAAPHYAAAVELFGELFGERHPSVIRGLTNLASLELLTGETESAEARFRLLLRLQREVLGEDHPMLGVTLNNLAAARLYQDDVQGAETLFRESLAVRREAYGGEHPDIAESLANLGATLRAQGRLDEAEEHLVEALALRRRLLPPEHPETGNTLYHLAAVWLDQGRSLRACKASREARHILAAIFPEGDWRLARTDGVVAGCLVEEGETEDAKRLLQASLAILERTRGPEAAVTREVAARLAALSIPLPEPH